MKHKINSIKWNHETDVLVIGTGGGGLTAAITAQVNGAKVMVIEKSDKVGGTTSVSGGVIWIPLNDQMKNIGVSDTREEALTYVKKLAENRIPDEILETLVYKGPEMVKFVEKNTTMRFYVVENYVDYHPDWEGGKPLGGRSLAPGLFDSKKLGAWKDKLRKSPIFGLTPITIQEAMKWGLFRNPKNLDAQLIADRLQDQIVGFGEALIGNLLLTCMQKNIEPLMSTSGKELITDENNKVIGLRAEQNGVDIFIKAKKGIILASGGYEWNKELMKQFLPGPEMGISTSPPFNHGDALTMTMEIGANLANMSEAWWFPGIQVPGEEYEGKPLMRLSIGERSLPHSIIVNKYGKRFVDEAHNYNDVAKVFNVFEPVKGEYPNVPAWLILGKKFFDKYVFITSMPGDEPPVWLKKGNTAEELAKQINIDAEGLKQTILKFNEYAQKGVDPEFGRGGNSYDQYQGDPENKPNPNLGNLEGPFYAMQVHLSNLGTKGGPVIDIHGRVLDVHNQPIEGLYAIGNAAMGITGPGYGGAGGTIAPAMVFGYLAALNAVQRKVEESKKEEIYA